MALQQRMSMVAGALLLSACATGPRAPIMAPPPPSIGAMIGAAEEAARLGQADKARSLLQAAASAYPADKEPWLRLAQRGLEAKHYREALVNALEVLARDGEDRAAHAIAVVSAARLAQASAAQLARGAHWSGPQRSEALDSTRQLLVSLGEGRERQTGRTASAGSNANPLPVLPSAPRQLPRPPGGPDLSPLEKLEALKKNAARGDTPDR